MLSNWLNWTSIEDEFSDNILLFLFEIGVLDEEEEDLLQWKKNIFSILNPRKEDVLFSSFKIGDATWHKKIFSISNNSTTRL